MDHFLHFSKGERIGLLMLILLCVGLFLIPAYLPDRSDTEATDFTVLKNEIERWYGASAVAIPDQKTKESIEEIVIATSFNPNQVEREQLEAHGLPKNTIRSWLSYTKKGGRFNSLRDLQKFRGLDANDLEKLKPYLVFASDDTPFAKTSNQTDYSDIEYSLFDPNTVSKQELMDFGIPEKVAGSWTKYAASGASFREPEDVQKIYGLKKEDYDRLLPFISIKETVEKDIIAFNDRPSKYESTNKPSAIIDINKATAEEWQQLRGIGPAYSKRIVNFRDKLGGFHSINQVAETYGLPDSVFQKIQLSLRPSPLLQNLQINQLSEKELAAHPYISYNDAKVIVQYRTNHGVYTSIDDFTKLYALEESTIQKISPYLVFD